MAAIIELEGLSKRYGTRMAVDALSLSVEAGEIFAFLGPNGAGKTTTLLMLLGLSEPTGGRALVLGYEPPRQALEIKRRVGYLPENLGFYGDLTARQNLGFVADLNGLASPDRAIENALETVGLARETDVKVEAFSRGMRQRLGLAELLIKDPRLLFLDEPTLGLDPEAIKNMLALIKSLSRDRGLTVVLSSHLLHLVSQLADRVAIMKAGRLMALGGIEELSRALGLPLDLELIYSHFFQDGSGAA